MNKEILFLLFFLALSVKAQDWETLIIEKADTSLSGGQIIELASGDLFLAIDNFLYFPNSVSIWSSGFPRYGFELIKIDREHQIVNRHLIEVGPSFKMGSLINFNNSLVVPVEIFTGFEPCISPFPSILASSAASDLAISKLSADATQYLTDTVFLHRDSSMCGHLELLATANINDMLHTLRYNFNENKLLFEIVNPVNFEIVQSRTIQLSFDPYRAFFDIADNAIIVYCALNKTLCKMDFAGNIQWTIEGIGSPLDIEMSPNNMFYWLRYQTYDDEEHTATICKFDKQGNLKQKWTFEDHRFTNIEPIANGMLLALENSEDGIILHVINENGRIANTIVYPVERPSARSVNLLKSSEVLIVADLLDAVNTIYCCIEVGENSPNKVLVIKAPLDQIWKPDIFSEEEIVVIFPNPVEDYVEIVFRDFLVNSENDFIYTLYNSAGVQIQTDGIQSPSQIVLLPNMPEGTYLLSIYKDGTLIKTEKIVKY